jgi:flagellar basal body rod protein FlgF
MADSLSISAAGAGLERPSTPPVRLPPAAPEPPRALALAVQGDAFLALQGPEELLFSTASLFQIDLAGRLATLQGLPLVPPVAVPREAESIFVSADGRILVVLADGAVILEIGRLEPVGFDAPGSLQPRGEGLFAATSASGPPRPGALATFFSGVLEARPAVPEPADGAGGPAGDVDDRDRDALDLLV